MIILLRKENLIERESVVPDSNKQHIPIDAIQLLMIGLALLFIGLKLTGHIDWSWWWVLAPLWGPAAVILTIAGSVIVWMVLHYVWVFWVLRRVAREHKAHQRGQE